jgi:hypothetical protein
MGIHRTSPREEQARQLARERTRDLEFAWATFLSRAMAQGVIPEADARLSARAVLGLHNSVWHWFRPGGDLPLDQVSDFFVARCLAVLGVPPEGLEGAGPPAASGGSKAKTGSPRRKSTALK